MQCTVEHPTLAFPCGVAALVFKNDACMPGFQSLRLRAFTISPSCFQLPFQLTLLNFSG